MLVNFKVGDPLFSNQNAFVTLAINDNLTMKLNFKESNEPKLIESFMKNIQQKKEN